MACDVNCPSQPCNRTGGQYVITGFSPPQSANAGDLVTINFAVSLNCGPLGCINYSFVVCLFDSNGACLSSSSPQQFPSLTTSIPMSLSYTQPTADFHGNLSLIGQELLGNNCYDSHIFTVKTNAPPGQGWSCDSVSKTCYSDSNSTTTYDQCRVACAGGGGGGTFGTCNPPCPSSDMCVLGMCLPKPLVLVGLAGLVFLMMSRGGK